MFKKYRFLIFFCFLVMLTGVSLLSIDKSYEIVVNEQEEQDSSDADSVPFRLTTYIYGLGQSGNTSNQLSLHYEIAVGNSSGKRTNSREIDMENIQLSGNKHYQVSSTSSQTFFWHRYFKVEYANTISSAKNRIYNIAQINLSYRTDDDNNPISTNWNNIGINTWYHQNCGNDAERGCRWTCTIYCRILYTFDYDGGWNSNGTNTSILYNTFNNKMELATGAQLSTLALPVKTGYTFQGYYTEKSGKGTQIINAKGQWTGNWGQSTAKPAQLYAHWTANKYTVTFDATNHMNFPPTVALNACNGTVTSEVSNNEYIINLKVTSTNNSSSGMYIGTSTPLTVGKEYYWSIYIKSTKSHAINIGHEQGGTKSDTVINDWKRITHKFKATSNSYQAFIIYSNNLSVGETLSFKNLSLQEVSSVGAEQATGSLYVTYGGKYTSLPTPSKTYYTFLGWYTAKTGDSKVTTSTTVTQTSNHTLYSRWTETEYDLKFNANGGSVSPDGKGVFYNSAYGDLPTPTRNGYTFTGWYTAATGGTKVSSTTKMTTAGATIYAHWTANTYAVSFDNTNYIVYPPSVNFHFNGISGTQSTRIENNESITSVTITSSPNNDAAQGFYIVMGKLTVGEKYTWSVDIKSTHSHLLRIGQEQGGNLTNYFSVTTSWQTLTWTYTATEQPWTAFEFYRGSGNWVVGEVFEFKNLVLKKTSDTVTDQVVPTMSYTFDQYYTNLPTPTRYGYNFTGWYTSASGGSQVTSSTQVKTADNHTLYSRWAAKTNCVLTFNANEGTVSPASRNQTFNASLGTLPVPTRTGYIFTGWYTQASRGSEVTSSTIMKSERMTIYAHWAETWAASHYSSALTQNGGYWLISSSADLARVLYLLNYTTRTDVLTMKFKLTNHIDMSAYYWLPIGTEIRPFGGVIDGQGYTIKGLHTISQSERRDNGGDNSGFIGIASGATIKNIFFENISISGKNYVGAVIGKVKGSNKTNVSGIAVRNDKTTVGERLVEATGTKGIIVGYSEVNQAAKVRDCLGVQGTSCGAYFQVATVDCKDSIGYIWNGSSYSMSKSAASNNFANWITVTGIPFQLPKGLAWIASGK